VPRVDIELSLIGGTDSVALLERMGLLFPSDQNPDIMVPYVSLFTLDIRHPNDNDWSHLVLITDWHPSVLSTINLGTMRQGSVMYIGPDSLALVAHWPIVLESRLKWKSSAETVRVLDFCCGSGVQALAIMTQLKVLGVKKCHATFVDINPRALRFTMMNAYLNGFDDKEVTTILSDITSSASDHNLNGTFDYILANPPFIPVPRGTTSKRYGLFSSGGISGEDVLHKIINDCPLLLSKSPHAVVGVVSEFMNPGSKLLNKIKRWWEVYVSSGTKTCGLLVTNEVPVTAEIYAKRRAGDNKEEVEEWKAHLFREEIKTVSPGVLFLCKTELPRGCISDQLLPSAFNLKHSMLPKGQMGSIWTPHNYNAVSFSLESWRAVFKA